MRYQGSCWGNLSIKTCNYCNSVFKAIGGTLSSSDVLDLNLNKIYLKAHTCIAEKIRTLV